MSFLKDLFGAGPQSHVDDTAGPTSLDSLRTQLFSTQYFGLQAIAKSGRLGELAMRQLGVDLFEVITEQTGEGERMLYWPGLGRFGKNPDELLRLARAQAAASATGNVQLENVGEGIQVMVSNGFYLSAYMLETCARVAKDSGLLVVPLSSHHWCTHLVSATTVPEHAGALAALAQDLSKKVEVSAAERLTTDVYYYRPDHRLERLTIVDGRAVSPELEQAIYAAFKREVMG